MNKWHIFVFTFLCYTSIHALRTTYSKTKSELPAIIHVQKKYMGIVDALMLMFLGIGHFMHTIHPIKKPVYTLWVACLLCAVNYSFIPLCMAIKGLDNIYSLSVLMSVNGYLQSYTWPNLLMIINNYFDPQKYSALLGFWSTNANFGNILGYLIFLVIEETVGKSYWPIGVFVASLWTIFNSFIIGLTFPQLEVKTKKQTKVKTVIKKINYKSYIHEPAAKSVYKPVVSAHLSSTHSQQFIRSVAPSKVGKNGEVVNIETPLSIKTVFKDPNVMLLTVAFSLTKSVIYGIMLWLPLYFDDKSTLKKYSSLIPIAYDSAAIVGSVFIGYLFKKAQNKGLLMIPFYVVLILCFLILKFVLTESAGPVWYFFVISIIGLALGGSFNTLSGLVVMELVKIIPENLKSTSLGFYSALTMAVGNITTALTQLLIGFAIGTKPEDQENIFLIFLIYSIVCLVCFIFIMIITRKQHGALSASVIILQDENQLTEGSDEEEEVVKSTTRSQKDINKSDKKSEFSAHRPLK